MGGTIRVDSEPGRGSCFTFTVRCETAAVEELAAALAAAEAPAGDIDLRGNVLLVEDNQTNQLLATRMLEKLGLRVDVAEDGGKALARLRAFDYDLVLMDCQMPGLDGFEATAQLRLGAAGETARHVAVVAMTANALVGDRERCLASGMDDYLAKPVRIADLQATVRRWLRVKHVAAESDVQMLDALDIAAAELESVGQPAGGSPPA